MTVEEYTECFSRALNASDINAIGALDSVLREVVETEVKRIDGNIDRQKELAEKLVRLNALYQQASAELQSQRDTIVSQRQSLKVAKAYETASAVI